jgi:hypothetical protein
MEIKTESNANLKRRILDDLANGTMLKETLANLKVSQDTFVSFRDDPEFDTSIRAIQSRILPNDFAEAKLKRLFERGEADSERYVEKITPTTAMQIAEKMGDALSRGLTYEQACIYVSVSPLDIRKYAEKNPDFFKALNEAEMRFSLFLIDKIMRHAQDDWKAASWLLERKYPEKWSDVKRVDIKQRAAIEKTTQIRDQKQMKGKITTVDVQKMSDEELRKMLESSRS